MSDLSLNFSRWEFACRCQTCGYDTVDAELIDILQKLRDFFDRPVHITSGTRCLRHNKYVGGSPQSQHLYGRAADVVVEGTPAKLVAEWAIDNGVPGVGAYPDFTHLDTRSAGMARW